jgi:hypothetical protein
MIKNSDFSERITQIIDNEKEKISTFSKKLGYGDKKNLYDVINKGILPSFEFFYLFILSEYSEIYDIKWLVTGEGQMYRNSSQKVPNKTTSHTISSENCDDLIKYLLKRIKDLEEEVDEQKKVEIGSDDVRAANPGSYKKTGG